MSSDSVNMSGAEGFFGFAPEMNKNNKTAQDEFLVIHHVVKQNIWNVFDSHTLQRSKHAASGRDTQVLDYKPATEWTHDRKKQN